MTRTVARDTVAIYIRARGLDAVVYTRPEVCLSTARLLAMMLERAIVSVIDHDGVAWRLEVL